MRKLLFFLLLILAGCGGDGVSGGSSANGTQTAWHTPEVNWLSVNPQTVMLMEGDGSIVASAELGFSDPGADLQALWIKITSDDGSDTIEFVVASGLEKGTLSEEFDFSTNVAGSFEVEVWVVDQAGQVSNHISRKVAVISDPAAWVERESNLPFALNAVHYSDLTEIFVAAGDGGTVMTSPDGVNWTLVDAGAHVNLHAIGFDLFDYVIVGDSATVLGSAGGTDAWIVQHSGDANVSLRGVSHRAWPIVAVGKLEDTGAPYVLRSPDHGQSWAVIDNLPRSGRWFSGVAWGWTDGLDVGSTWIEVLPNDGRLFISDGGEVWNEVIIDVDAVSTLSVIWDEDGYWVGGTGGRIYRSPDGVNWTKLQTPVDTDFSALAWSGVNLIAHGSAGSGAMTSDDGQSWLVFDIAADYESRGLAYGNGRFVSVGQSTADPGKGAIYTSP